MIVAMGQVASLRWHQWGTSPHNSAQLKLRSLEEAQGRAPVLQSWRVVIIVNKATNGQGTLTLLWSGHTKLAISLRTCYLDMLTKHNTNIV